MQNIRIIPNLYEMKVMTMNKNFIGVTYFLLKKVHDVLLNFSAFAVSQESRLKRIKPCLGFLTHAAGAYGAAQDTRAWRFSDVDARRSDTSASSQSLSDSVSFATLTKSSIDLSPQVATLSSAVTKS